ncbi:hypothetical protein DMUE_1380 [Dictyocoela muelleri]|nr:hypothetical protein DMUE_1380 [Dictyocoela muelleri]
MIKEGFYILVATDLFSRYSEIKFINDINSKTICKSLEEMWFKQHPIPSKCLTDSGRQFKSLNFNNLMKKYRIDHIFTSTHNPTGNYIIERINREISVALRLSRNNNLKTAGINI